MNQERNITQWLSIILVALCLASVTGCATTGYQQADKTGQAINTVRNDVAKIKSAVDASMKALDGLEASATTDPRKPFQTFSASVDKVEAAAKVAKAHAEDMQTQGAAYFQLWQQQIESVKNEDIRKLAQERKTKLQQTFSNINTVAQDTKESFPPFLSDLKDLRTALGSDLTVEGIDSAKDVILKTKDAGAAVEKNLDKLILEFDSVYAAITAARPPQ